MDKYEYKLRADEIRQLIKEGKYSEAEEIADTIDWRNVKNGTMLCTISDLYKVCRRYEDARDVLLLAYERNPGGKLIVYSLCELSIKLENTVDAWEYYKEYLRIAPKDTGRYILQYKIYEAQGVTLEERIAVLEELQKRECKAKWMYELAYLYHRVGLGSSCTEQCDQVVAFFGTGKYVIKALELKMLHTELSEDQQELYRKLTTVEEDIVVPEMNVGQYNTIDLQKELADNLKDYLTDEPAPAAPAEELSEEVEITEEPQQFDTKVVSQDELKNIENATVSQDTVVYTPVEEEKTEEEVSAEVALDPTVLSDTREIPQEEMTEVVPTPAPSEEAVTPEPASGEESGAEEAAELTKVLPVGEIKAEEITARTTPDTDVVEFTTDTLFGGQEEETKEETKEKAEPEELLTEEDGQTTFFDETKSVSLGSTRVYSREEIEKALGGSKVTEEYTNAEGKVNFDDMLSLEGDGQISLVVPEQAMVEKQITGQLCIDEVLLEYDQISRDNEKKWTEGIRQRIQDTCGSLIEDFEKESRTGLLEQLEESMKEDPKSVPFGPNLTEKEAIYYEDEIKAQNENGEEEVLLVEDEAPASQTEAEPTAEELTFDRTPFAEEEKEAAEEVTPSDQAAENSVGLDYLMQFAENAEKQDLNSAGAALAGLAAAGGMTEILPEEIREEEKDTPAVEEVPTEKTEVHSGDTQAMEEISRTVQEMLEKEAAEEEAKKAEEEETEILKAAVEEETAKTEDAESVEETGKEASGEDKEEEPLENPEEEEPFGDPEDTEIPGVVREEEVPGEETSGEEEPLPSVKEPEEDLHEGFTEAQWNRFESFVQTEVGREQIREALLKISAQATTGNVIIGSVDTDSAIELGKELITEESRKGAVSSKAAKIKASSLNAKDPEETFAKLYGSSIIIQDAEELRPDTLKGMKEALSDPEKTILVILTVAHRHKHKFIMENADLLESFNVSIDVEALDNAELVKLARDYAYSREYSINEMGALALHTMIEEKQSNSHSVTYKEVKEMIDSAIDHASRHSMGHFFGNLLGKRYDDNDMIILGEKDFT